MIVIIISKGLCGGIGKILISFPFSVKNILIKNIEHKRKEIEITIKKIVYKIQKLIQWYIKK